VAGLVASYLGLYFYLRVIQYMFMQDVAEGAADARGRRLAWLAGALCLVPAIAFAVFPGWLLDRL
jgi:NADH-quinone oxidoreductase subunit N